MSKKDAMPHDAVDLLKLPMRVRLDWAWMDTLVRTVWGEARGQGFEGMLAVACVIMNRTLAGTWYGRDPKAVCLKRWQFSCWNKGDPNLQKMLNQKPGDDVDGSMAHMAIFIAARIAGTDKDPTKGATHYHTKAVSPEWSKGKRACRVIGDHRFFNNID